MTTSLQTQSALAGTTRQRPLRPWPVLMPVDRKALASDRAEHAIDTKNDWCLMWSAPADRRVTVVGAWSAKRR